MLDIDINNIIIFQPSSEKDYTQIYVDNNLTYQSISNGFYLTDSKNKKFKIIKSTWGKIGGLEGKQIINQEEIIPSEKSSAMYNEISVKANQTITLIYDEKSWEVPSLRFFKKNP